MFGSLIEDLKDRLFGRRSKRECTPRYVPWGDSEQPDPPSQERDLHHSVRERAEDPGVIAVQPWECLRSEKLLFLLQTMHTPFKTISDDEEERLDANLRRIEEALASTELEKYAAECYALRSARGRR